LGEYNCTHIGRRELVAGDGGGRWSAMKSKFTPLSSHTPHTRKGYKLASVLLGRSECVSAPLVCVCGAALSLSTCCRLVSSWWLIASPTLNTSKRRSRRRAHQVVPERGSHLANHSSQSPFCITTTTTTLLLSSVRPQQMEFLLSILP